MLTAWASHGLSFQNLLWKDSSRRTFPFTSAANQSNYKMEHEQSTLAAERHTNFLPARLIALVVLCACAFGFWSAGRDGLSKLMSEYGTATGSIVAATRALDFGSTDAGAHFAQATLSLEAGEVAQSLPEFQRAVALRPADYYLWLQLGRAFDAAGNDEASRAAFEKAISLAPSYAEPHWQLGNLLLRRGEEKEAFAELHRAAASDSERLAPLLDLAWGFYQGDAHQVLQVTVPKTDAARILLADFFIKHGKAEESIDLLRGVGTAQVERRRLVKELIDAQKFAQARTVWLMDAEVNERSRREIFDGGFEFAIAIDEAGFGWRAAKSQTIDFAVDAHLPDSGTHSLEMYFHGELDPGVTIISQLVLVEPRSRYRLSFAARTKDLLSAGLPAVTVRQWRTDGLLIATSSPMTNGTKGWQIFSFTFDSGDQLQAVSINIQRQRCASYPCPIFGHAWFDSFVLEKL
ncbi:MAG: Tetratricopeptide repeat [Blastocatellia bacterium]|jgi:tetratricopeptide (TPR) repeat protein|nr:Tetratricopeptide repeat [Blastocatellia bacterium]